MIDESRIEQIFDESIMVKNKSKALSGNIAMVSREIVKCLNNGGKILLFGNGGSAADSQHIAAEFINRFQMERNPLPAIALTTDTSNLTSIGNDYGFEHVFEKQVQALGKSGDVAIGISTSGNSKNVIKAMKKAKELGLVAIGFSGIDGVLKNISDISISVPSDITARIQEVHITIFHIICELVEKEIFK